MTPVEKSERERPMNFAEWLASVPRCVGDSGGCDGDLVATAHEESCPMYKVQDSAGKTFGATFSDCWQAAFEAGRSAGPAEQKWELDLYQKAHIEMHAYMGQVGETCCEFCEALERVHTAAGPIADKGDGNG